MAYIKYLDGTARNITAAQGIALWKALHDPTGLDEAQLNRLAKIQSLYLNWRQISTPDAYIKENLDYIIPMALSEWKVDASTGKPTKPDTQDAWAFAKRWGLWEHGQPSILVNPGSVFPVKS